MRRELLRAAAGVGIFLVLLVGLALFSSRTQPARIELTLSATPEAGSPGVLEAWVGELIVPPQPAAEFDLLDRSGARLTLQDLKGKLTLMSFAYTSCPDVCPILFSRFLAVQEAFADLIGKELVLVFMTVDPEVDTPERLNQMTEAMGGRWYFLTGEPAKMEQVWRDYRVYVKKEGLLVAHSNVTYLIDRNGLIRLRYGGIPPAEALISDIEGWIEK